MSAAKLVRARVNLRSVLIGVVAIHDLRPPSAEKIHEAIEDRICGSTPIRFP